MQPFFQIELPAYGTMAFLGAIAVIAYCVVRNRRADEAQKIQENDLLNIALLCMLGAIVGGMILYAITMLPYVISGWALYGGDVLAAVGDLFGGMVFYGGAIGAVGATYFYCRRNGVMFRNVAALMGPAIPLFHTFGRIGCFFAGCCWGIESATCGIAFTHSHVAPNGIPLFPVQLVEAGCNLLLFFALHFVSKKLQRKWMVLPLYIVCYGVIRFTLEFFRGDEMRGVFLLSTSQWISLLLIAGVAILYVCKWRKKKV